MDIDESFVGSQIFQSPTKRTPGTKKEDEGVNNGMS